MTAIITCSDPRCDDRLPCDNCTATWLQENRPEMLERPEWRVFGSGRSVGIAQDFDTPRSTGGSGIGSGASSASTSTARMATERQIAYLTSLAAQTGEQIDLDAANLTAADASSIIDRLKQTVETMRSSETSPTADTPLTGRWRKTNGAWVIVTNRDAETGAEVTVVKANGDERAMTLGERLDECTFRPGDDASGTSSAAANLEVIEGMAYMTADDRVVRVARSKSSDNLYGLVWDGSDFVYEAGLLRKIVRQITLKEARSFGAEWVKCCCCGRKLTNPSSKAAGIGPVCADRF
jgi:hypothetical protein